MKNTLSREILFGTAVGDALGVPVEFKPREYLVKNPVKEMTGYGTHHQPPGTWSDDSSLTFCLAESLYKGYNINDIAGNFVKWMDEGFWTPFGKVFDIGITTSKAIHNLKKGVEPTLAGESDEYSNGNGSLMRILPLLPYIANLDFKEQVKIISEVSSITHRHPRSFLGCILLLIYANQLQYESPRQSLGTLKMNFRNDIWEFPELENEMIHFKRLFDGMKIDKYNSLEKADPTAYKTTSLMKATLSSISTIEVDKIKSSGYVVHTLEASIWCLVNTTSFKDAVLMAVNLGDDTDTTGAVTGALAAIYYGYDAIPKEWTDQIARKDEIMTLANRMDNFFLNQNSKHNK